ncbi:MAG TPA: RluA family pseudouridine synthase [Opitutae bacterium]|nr:RluA family pseudouridine synthase [Opitutae bacterium]
MAGRIIEFEVPRGAKAGRADKIFAAAFEDVSRVRLQKAFEAGAVTFDGQVIDKRFKVNRPGSLRAVLEEPKTEEGPKAVDIPLQIIYEDESLVVVNKMPGMITHPGNGTGDDTLVHALLHHTNGQLSSVGAPERPGIVHRLDKETSGLIVVAKSDLAHHKLATCFSERETYKRYTALVQGVPKLSRGSVKEPIGRHPVMRTKMAAVSNGKEAHTDWEVLERYGNQAAQVSCVIHTGRTHQIRVHMSSLKFPLLGDPTYGFKSSRLKGITVPRVMLHSTELHIQHPESDALMEFLAPLPQDFEAMVAHLQV